MDTVLSQCLDLIHDKSFKSPPPPLILSIAFHGFNHRTRSFKDTSISPFLAALKYVSRISTAKRIDGEKNLDGENYPDSERICDSSRISWLDSTVPYGEILDSRALPSSTGQKSPRRSLQCRVSKRENVAYVDSNWTHKKVDK